MLEMIGYLSLLSGIMNIVMGMWAFRLMHTIRKQEQTISIMRRNITRLIDNYYRKD
jgi:hypothetical protein